ncbi:MAG: enolase C-terminal domain-like protein [Candidatus Pacearchaeota archaeon]
MNINWIKANKILDSRGKETIEVIINLDNKIFKASAPSGTSKSKKEVRDFSFKGINYSIELIEKIGKEIIDYGIKINEFNDLEKVEDIIKKYDPTNDLHIIGGNAVYALEAALIKSFSSANNIDVWRFLSDSKIKPNIRPIGNCIGGGKHTEISNKPEFQEFLVIPKTKKFFESCFIMNQAYKKAKEILERMNKFVGLTIENSLVAKMNNEEILDLLIEVKENIKENFDISLDIGIDVAANNFFVNNVYEYKTKMQKLSASRQLEYIYNLIKKYNLFYVEDPFHEDDFESFGKLLKLTNSLIVGDDLTATNHEIIKKAIEKKAINAVIIKPNQVGSLIKTKMAVDIAKKYGINCIISHRSGETMDDFIADLAIAWKIPFIKTGIIGKEREIKLRRIINIEKILNF